MGMGAVLSLAPINPVQAGSFNREIVNPDGQKIGRLAFTWDDSKVTNNILEHFDSLTSFYLTNNDKMNYDLEFAKNTLFQNFEFNLINGKLRILGINLLSETSTGQSGFTIWSKDFDSDVISSSEIAANLPNNQTLNQALAINQYSINLDFAISTHSVDGNTLQEPIPQDPQGVPENSLTTALLLIAGLIFLSPQKIF